jgi:hypothetical protein
MSGRQAQLCLVAVVFAVSLLIALVGPYVILTPPPPAGADDGIA